MINVEFVKNQNDTITQCKVYGHARFSEYGKDIVCAAVSGAMAMFEAVVMHEGTLVKDGDTAIIEFFAKDDSDIANNALRGLELFMQSMQEQYPKYLKVEIRRK